ncbi:response regulator [Mesorhizobium sp. BH1-1-5]|uniref:response regulator n=1 Tax=Mesorhizobium sp. BH1-1-5 TaxID=2876661 RepID=UPI001CC91446|nr:response regulator [Mesorhizobium sp. BH1-1-5]MBZ9988150.1 response regulator [Mesorhizobium sp. BH1-1-5]
MQPDDSDGVRRGAASLAGRSAPAARRSTVSSVTLLIRDPDQPTNAPDKTDSALATDGQTSSRTGPAGPARILVVEDDYLISMETENTLVAAGFAVSAVAPCEEALKIAASGHPVLAVMDIRLAGRMDGIETAVECFGTYGLHSVFATAHSDQATRSRAAAAEPLGWLVKPYASTSLLTAVRNALRLSPAAQA